MAVLPLLFRRHLAEGLARARHQEDRVVAEAGLSPPLGHDLAATLALEELRIPARRREGDHAYESGLPGPWYPLEPAQKLRRPFLLGGAEACRADARKAPQRFKLDTRVIAQ